MSELIKDLADEIAVVRHGQAVTANDLAERLEPWLIAHNEQLIKAEIKKRFLELADELELQCKKETVTNSKFILVDEDNPQYGVYLAAEYIREKTKSLVEKSI